ncbi:hypothetical protein VTJ83DRAFT_2683 [Remersonia thermophila]|uniref:Uncharacterized protein n=1 Tax=Remersonia thermophila TaxID=72144 RepID=A0ABR4DKG0_9PEZI
MAAGPAEPAAAAQQGRPPDASWGDGREEPSSWLLHLPRPHPWRDVQEGKSGGLCEGSLSGSGGEGSDAARACRLGGLGICSRAHPDLIQRSSSPRLSFWLSPGFGCGRRGRRGRGNTPKTIPTPRFVAPETLPWPSCQPLIHQKHHNTASYTTEHTKESVTQLPENR